MFYNGEIKKIKKKAPMSLTSAFRGRLWTYWCMPYKEPGSELVEMAIMAADVIYCVS